MKTALILVFVILSFSTYAQNNSYVGKWQLTSHGCKKADGSVRNFVPFQELLTLKKDKGSVISSMDGCSITADFEIHFEGSRTVVRRNKVMATPNGCAGTNLAPEEVVVYKVEGDKLMISHDDSLIGNCETYFMSYKKI